MAQDIGTPRQQAPLQIPMGGTRTALDPATVRNAQGQGQVVDAYGQVWMGPGPIPVPQGPQDERPRQFDYPLFWNIWRNPATAKTADGGIDFGILREFAKQTLVRVAIETIKDLDGGNEYVFTLKANPNERPGEVRARAQRDRRVQEVSDFFESPDGLNDFVTWRRMAWEEIAVCDNLTAYRWEYEFASKSRKRPYAIKLIDGDTIEPLIDGSGYEPAFPNPAYDQWIKGLPRRQFNTQELLYTPFNPRVKYTFGHSPVEQVLWYINILIRRDLRKSAEYTDGNIPAGLLGAPDTWVPEQIQQAQLWLDSYMSGDPAGRSKLIFVPGGSRAPVFPGERQLADEFDDLLTRLICYAFNVSVVSLIKIQNRATATTSAEQAEEEGFVIRTRKMTRFINRCIRWAFGDGYADVIAVPKQQRDQDPVKQANIDFQDLQTGKKQLNEVRERDGLAPVPALSNTFGYFDPKNGFMTFDAAITAAQNAAAMAGTVPPPSSPPADNFKVIKADNFLTGHNGYVYVIRHGCTDLNSADNLRGFIDIDLNEQGKADAANAGTRLIGQPLDIIIPGDLKRTMQTGAIVSSITGAPLGNPEYGLRTWNVGRLAGTSATAAAAIMQEYATVRPDEMLEGGESFNTFKSRLFNCLQRLCALYDGKNFAVVTSHMPERLIAAWLRAGAPSDCSIDGGEGELLKDGLDNGEMTVYGRPAGSSKVAKFQKKKSFDYVSPPLRLPASRS